MAQAPARLVEAARQAALPHSFDAPLLGAIGSTAEAAADLIERLQAAGLVAEAGAAGHYALQASFREMFVQAWQSEDLPGYRAANTRAAAHLASQGPEMDRADYVYFQLGADDERGIAALTAAVEEALSLGHGGTAERLLLYAGEQEPTLGPAARAWLTYLGARLDLYSAPQARQARAAERLQGLLAGELPPDLRAHTLALLAGTQGWAAAQPYYSQAVEAYLALNDPLSAGQVYAGRGDALVRLAGSLGGLSPESPAVTQAVSLTWLVRLRDAPFLLYRWCSRRLSWLPSLYFSGDYQDWIILRLLDAAAHQYRLALRLFGDVRSGHQRPAADDQAANVCIRLADLYHRTGRWSIAERQFAILSKDSMVRANPYRQATLDLAQGRAALARGRPRAAHAHLAAAQPVFGRYGDRSSLAEAARMSGDGALSERQPDAAVAHYVEAIAAARAAGDLLMATGILARLNAVRRRIKLSEDSAAGIERAEVETRQRAYVARFPGAVLARVRGLAAYLALPLGYPAILLVVLLQLFALANAEQLYLRLGTWSSYAGTLAGLVQLLIALLAAPLLALWLYQLVYLVAGGLYVRRLPLKGLTERQPEYVVLIPEGITIQDEQGREHSTRWEGIERYASLNRCLWRLPAGLFSQVALKTGSTTILLEGITNHYEQMQADISARLGDGEQKTEPSRYDLDVSLLGSRWTLAAVALAAGGTWRTLAAGVSLFSTFGDAPLVELRFSAALLIFYLWAAVSLPLVSLMHLLLKRAAARRALGPQALIGPDWPLWAGILILAGLATGMIYVLWP